MSQCSREQLYRVIQPVRMQVPLIYIPHVGGSFKFSFCHSFPTPFLLSLLLNTYISIIQFPGPAPSWLIPNCPRSLPGTVTLVPLLALAGSTMPINIHLPRILDLFSLQSHGAMCQVLGIMTLSHYLQLHPLARIMILCCIQIVMDT